MNVHSKSSWNSLLRAARTTLLLLSVAGTTRADFHVAPSGSNANDGSASKPFLTLERARDAVRELKRTRALPAVGITVWLRQGDFIRTNALELTSADSGTDQSPITWQGYPGERARLLGGRML